MSNPVNTFDFSESLSTLLARTVSDGTYADVLSTIKTDEIAAAATDIASDCGQLWSNLSDDYVLITYPFFEGRAPEVVRDELPSASGAVTVHTIATVTNTAKRFTATAYISPTDEATGPAYVQTLDLLLVNASGTLTATVINSSEVRVGSFATPAEIVTTHAVSGTDYLLRWEQTAYDDASIDLHIDIEKTLRTEP